MGDVAWWLFVYLPAAAFWIGVARQAIDSWRYDDDPRVPWDSP